MAANDPPRRPSSQDVGSSSDDSTHKPARTDVATGHQDRSEPLFEKADPFAADRGQGGKREITEAECDGQLGYHFPEWKKWTVLSVIFVVQVSMVSETRILRGCDCVLIHLFFFCRISTLLFTPTTWTTSPKSLTSVNRQHDVVR